MAGQLNRYVALLDDIARIDPPDRFTSTLPQLSAEPIREDDALALLVLAESSMRARQWQAAAQLFARMMVSSFSQTFQDAELVEHAKRVTLYAARGQAQLQSRTDLLLYGHRRLTAALRGDGMQQPHIGHWMVAAVSQLLRGNEVRIAATAKALATLSPGNAEITKRYQPEIGPVRQLLTYALSLAGNDNASVSVSNGGRCLYLAILMIAVIAIVGVSYALSGWFAFPRVSSLLDPSRFDSWLGTALIAWPLLLLATWIFAFAESIRTHTLFFISPVHLAGPKIVAGEIIPFSRDLFFHIFQFVWVALLIVAWLLFKGYQDLPAWLSGQSPAAQNAILQFIQSPTVPFLPQWPASAGIWSILRALLVSDAFALLVAIGACLYSIHNQRKIQRQRIETGADTYWWDRRFSPTEFWIRLIMVGLDMFLASFLVVKVSMMVLVAYEVVTSNILTISYFSPDGVGGLKPFTDMLMYLSWAVFIFGMFVFASLYLHWNLRQYRRKDLTLLCVYVLFVAVAVVPLGLLELKLTNDKDVLLGKLEKTGSNVGTKLDDTGKYVQNINAVRDWRVSAVNVGILGNPILPLGFQLVVVLFQFFGRAGKLPKLPIPSLSDDKGSKTTHDAA